MQTLRTLLALAAIGALASLAHPAHADVTIRAVPSAATAGGTGTFDVYLVNSLLNPDGTINTTTVNLESFTFELTVGPASGIVFTGADMTTAFTYIFSGNSFDTASGFTLSPGSFPTTDVSASDTANVGSTAVGAGQTFGLGRISYSVASGAAPGSFAVSFVPDGTSLADSNSAAIPFSTQNGMITVGPALSAPEPSQFAALGTAGLALCGLALRARRRSPRCGA